MQKKGYLTQDISRSLEPSFPVTNAFTFSFSLSKEKQKTSNLQRTHSKQLPPKPTYAFSPFRNQLKQVQQQKLLKYIHSRHITEEISNKSESETEKPKGHRRDHTTNFNNNSTKLNGLNVGSGKHNPTQELMKGKNSQIPKLKVLWFHSGKENKPKNPNQSSRFRIISAEAKQQHEISDILKLDFKHHTNQLKTKSDSCWMNTQKGTHHLHNNNKSKDSNQKNIKRVNAKHVRHNTEISGNHSNYHKDNKADAKQQNIQPILSAKETPKNLNFYPKPAIPKTKFNKIKLQSQCSVIQQHDSQVQICLKALEITKTQNQQTEKNVNVSFLDQENDIETNTNTMSRALSVIVKKTQEYRKGKLLGKGYYGKVYFGQHVNTGVVCALKYLNIKRLKEEDMLEPIKRQIECQVKLSHPNICKIYDYFMEEDGISLVLVLEFVEGQQLYKKLIKKNRFNEQECGDLMFQIVSAVEHIHSKKIIHRDIKPENIMITNGIAKICDFGCSVMTSCSRKTICGTPLYSCPEIILGQQYDNKCDIWALGILAYEMLIGTTPFKIYGEHQLIKIAQQQLQFPSYVDISSKAKDFIMRILHKDPSERMTIPQILQHPFIRRRKRLIERTSNTYPQLLPILFNND